MDLIGRVKKNNQEWWVVYRWQKEAWQEWGRYALRGQPSVYHFLQAQHHTFQLALLGLHLGYRNTLYTLRPSIQVIVPPVQLYQYVSSFYKPALADQDEVAISIDNPLSEQISDLMAFLHYFYACDNLSGAYKIYENWQLQRALTDSAADKLQLVMEIFKDEIFNYFSYKELLKPILH